MRNYYDYSFHRHKLLNHSDFISGLSSSLSSEVCLFLHRDTVQQVPLFEDCDPNFLVKIVQSLTYRVYMPGDYIVRLGEVSSAVWRPA